MATILSAPPLQTALIESAQTGLITRVWHAWFRSLVDRAQVAAYAVTSVNLTGQSASIGATSLIPLASGLYRVSYRFRVTTAAGVSSSLQVTFTTTDGAVTVNYQNAAYTGNAVNAPQSGTFIIRTDPSTPLTYSVTYASNAAGAMIYALDITVEQL